MRPERRAEAIVSGHSSRGVVPIMEPYGQGPSIQIRTFAGVTLPDTMVSPATIFAALDDVNAHVGALNTDIIAARATIQANADGQLFLNNWAVFKSEWLTWYGPHRHSILTAEVGYWTAETVASLRSFAGRYNVLEDRAIHLGVHPTPVGGPNEGGNPDNWLGLPVVAWVGIGAGVVSLGFIAWIASSVSKVAAPIARATAGLGGRKKKRKRRKK